jgi:hypothetical protein
MVELTGSSLTSLKALRPKTKGPDKIKGGAFADCGKDILTRQQQSAADLVACQQHQKLMLAMVPPSRFYGIWIAKSFLPPL